MLLDPCLLSTRKFTVNAALRQMTAEASELGFAPGSVPAAPLYTDAADVGITLTSVRTAQRTHWYQSAEQVDGGGDVVAWVYKPTVETVRRHPRCKDWEVRIFND